MQRPTREHLDALVTLALLAGCGAPTPPVSSGSSGAPAATPAGSGPEAAPSAVASSASSAAPPAPSASAAHLAFVPPAFHCEPAAPQSSPSQPHAQSPEACVDGLSSALAQVSTACAVDSLTVFERRGWETTRPFQGVSRGTSCAGASAPAVCAERVAQLVFPERGGFSLDSRGAGPRAPDAFFVVVTRRDAVELISNEAELRELIGPIDSPNDALVALALDGVQGACADLRHVGKQWVIPKLELLTSDCPFTHRNFRLVVDEKGKVTQIPLGPARVGGGCAGRRPPGLLVKPGRCIDDEDESAELGAYLAGLAELEAAAVLAFEQLAEELAAHKAPGALLARCRVAAEEERRHAALMTAAARRYGAEPGPVTRAARPTPKRFTLAAENVVEGCVRETWGALSALVQARTAREPALAALFASLAEEEASHALLSFDLDEWLRDGLDAGEHKTLDQLAALAEAELRAELTEPSPALATRAGAPSRALATALLDARSNRVVAVAA